MAAVNIVNSIFYHRRVALRCVVVCLLHIANGHLNILKQKSMAVYLVASSTKNQKVLWTVMSLMLFLLLRTGSDDSLISDRQPRGRCSD